MQSTTNDSTRPNIIIILADDMGFSDIGCFGSEIETPALDGLAEGGLRFTQMYNCARCCPTRASLLTGVNPHQAGVGHMVGNYGHRAYQGYLRDDCATLAEVLKSAGYRTLMSGKWHVGGGYQANKPETWSPGETTHPIPVQRGFDEHYGMLGGGGSYFHPPYMIRNRTMIRPDLETDTGETYYLTDAVSREAVSMIRRTTERYEDNPFFLYVAYTAPHWPLHAFEEDIEKYRGRYRRYGWDGLRTSRHEALNCSGILDPKWEISPRNTDAPAWEDVREKEWEDLRMAVYAAQIDRMDQGIKSIIDELRRNGTYDNTLIFFLSDNGGCAEFLAEESSQKEPFRYNIPTPDGRRIRFGNIPEIAPGPDDTFASYDLPWANASNSPFRLFKHWVHEGGISTPCIIHWPEAVKTSGVFHAPCHVMDITATCIDAAGAKYPSEINGKKITPIEGESFLDRIHGKSWDRSKPIILEHEGNRAVREDDWKLVSKYPGEWELYHMREDRTELHDLSARESERVKRMSRQYDEWAKRCDVIPWDQLR